MAMLPTSTSVQVKHQPRCNFVAPTCSARATARSSVHCRSGPLNKRSMPPGSRGFGMIAPRFERLADMMERFEDEFSDAFGNRASPSEFMEGLFPSASIGMRVAVDVKEEDDRYEVVADVPGLSKEDITIQLNQDRVLTLSGERKSEEEKDEDGYYRLERKFGKFMRSFQLPKDVEDEKIRAKCEAGVLTVTIPKIAKPEEEPGPKVIDIE